MIEGAGGVEVPKALFYVRLGMQGELLPDTFRRVRKVIGSVNIWILIYVRYNQQVIRRIGSRKQRQPAQMISCHR